MRRHEAEVETFLRGRFGGGEWNFAFPPGSGHETYFAAGAGARFFVKVGAEPVRAAALAAAGLSPPLLASGRLADGEPILVQPYIVGRKPRPRDFQAALDTVAGIVGRMHRDPGVRAALPAVADESYRAAGMAALAEVRLQWARVRDAVPAVAPEVDTGLDRLEGEIAKFVGTGLVAAHRDICNANWLLTASGAWYVLDPEAMALDDPAADLGPLLWWYYPPPTRSRFLALAGQPGDAGFAARLRARLALHCLRITLSRAGSFDSFNSAGYDSALTDFRAALSGAENPQGYG
ncbi:MAG: phosphotransferase family protein [Chloroflexia bacterium]